MSVRTPFTNVNCGKEESRYGGQNKILRNWYDSKQFKGVNPQGYALNKLNQQADIYSQFSDKQSIMKGFNENDRSNVESASSSKLSSLAASAAFDSLRKNEFFHMPSYEAFLAKKYRVGKKTMFLNKDLDEEAKEQMLEHLRVAE